MDPKTTKKAPSLSQSAYPDDIPSNFQMGIRIKARSVQPDGDGQFVILVDAKPLTREQGALLEQLFPTQFNNVEKLLAAEALIASIV